MTTTEDTAIAERRAFERGYAAKVHGTDVTPSTTAERYGTEGERRAYILGWMKG
jgi:hypothetical protein